MMNEIIQNENKKYKSELDKLIQIYNESKNALGQRIIDETNSNIIQLFIDRQDILKYLNLSKIFSEILEEPEESIREKYDFTLKIDLEKKLKEYKPELNILHSTDVIDIIKFSGEANANKIYEKLEDKGIKTTRSRLNSTLQNIKQKGIIGSYTKDNRNVYFLKEAKKEKIKVNDIEEPLLLDNGLEGAMSRGSSFEAEARSREMNEKKRTK